MKLIFLGWTEAYETAPILSLKDDYQLEIFVLPKWLLKAYRILPASLIQYLFKAYILQNRELFQNADGIYTLDDRFHIDFTLATSIKTKSVIFRNTVSEKYIGYTENNELQCFTFDSSDAEKYKLKYYNQFLTLPSIPPKINSSHLFYFLGREKSRLNAIEKMQKVAMRFNKESLLIAIKDNDHSKMLSYYDNVINAANSDVLVDITNPGQIGITLRVLEALLLQKKLITNNSEVLQYPFYSSNNTLLVNFDSPNLTEEIQAFIKRPFETIDENIKNQYSGKQVLNKIIEETLM